MGGKEIYDLEMIVQKDYRFEIMGIFFLKIKMNTTNAPEGLYVYNKKCLF